MAAASPASRSGTTKVFVSWSTWTTLTSRDASVPPVRVLLVSQMYPGPDDPDLGVFVAQLARALERRGHEVDRAVLDRRAGGKRRYLELARAARRRHGRTSSTRTSSSRPG